MAMCGVGLIMKYLDSQRVNRGCLCALRRPSNSENKETLGFRVQVHICTSVYPVMVQV